MNDDLITNSKRKYIGEIILGAVQAAVLFLPMTFLVDIVSWKDDQYIYTFLIIGISALFYGIALVSRSMGQFVLKWLLSLPVSATLWYYFVQTHFSIRSLNWVFPDYGKQSAGGAFASAFFMVVQFGSCFLTWCIACFYSGRSKDGRKSPFLDILQKAVCSSICIGIAVIVVVLERTFPSYYSLSIWG